MNKYNFDKLKDRRKSSSLKWDVKENELPMWVADMDFECLEEIKESIIKIGEFGIFGYSELKDSYFEAYSKWLKKRHNFDVDIKNMVYSSGVVASISSMVRKLTSVGEKVLVFTPTYNIFFNSIINNGRFVVESPLIYDSNYNYSFDFNDIEEKLKDPQLSLIILCNPQNPVGKINTKEEMLKLALLADKYHKIIISDEIHSDITIPSKEYIPFLSIGEIAKRVGISCHALGKTFNVAGIQAACIICFDENRRYKIFRGINTDEVGEPNIFAQEVTLAAINNGDRWVDELNEYIYNNKKIFVDLINNSSLKIKTYLSDATYLAWVDCRKYNKSSNTLEKEIREKTGLIISSGSIYGKSGEGFIRINLGTSKENVIKGANKIIEYFKELEK